MASDPAQNPAQELEELRIRLSEAEETIRAIRSGEVDSLVVEGPEGLRVYTLEGANNSYRVLVEAMNEGAATLTDTGTVLYCNRRFAGMLGVPVEQAMGSMLHERISAEDLREFERLLRTGWKGTSRGELRFRRADGSSLQVHLSMSALVDGEPVLCVVAVDMTEQLRAQELLEADRRKNEFLGMLSHELRNPLGPLRNGIYLLDRAVPGSAQAEKAKEVIRRQTEHLIRLVDDLLDVTRISHGKIGLQRKRVDLCDIVRGATDDLRSLFDENDVELRVEHRAGPVWVDADPVRITQVVTNLLHNAVKFTEPGGTAVVGVTMSEGRAEISVRDTGAGIEPGHVQQMFEPFAQADRGIARTKGGLGLGLALVKSLVELHGGSVRARSDGLGKGSEFVVVLPLSSAGLALAERPAASTDASKRLVLIIEDNVDAGQSLADILELKGHRVRVALDGRSGIEMARAVRPDLVLCDIGLPDVDGYEIARLLRGDEDLRAVRLIALSGYAQPEDVERALQAGFDGHLSKPAGFEELDEILSR